MKRLLGTKFNTHENDEVNAMDGIVNLVDVMLVLVVGFMLALIINWNLDVGAIAHLSSENQEAESALAFEGEYMEEIDSDGEEIDSREMEKLGSVYFDESTGRYYIIVE